MIRAIMIAAVALMLSAGPAAALEVTLNCKVTYSDGSGKFNMVIAIKNGVAKLTDGYLSQPCLSNDDLKHAMDKKLGGISFGLRSWCPVVVTEDHIKLVAEDGNRWAEAPRQPMVINRVSGSITVPNDNGSKYGYGFPHKGTCHKAKKKF
jgi:hypothetical protein